MFDRISPAVRAVGMAWYRRADYTRIKQVMVDSEKLPTTFDKWQTLAEKGEQQLKAKGHLVIRVHIDPEEFVAWCASNNCEVDADGRMAFANAEAYRQVRQTH